MKSLKKNTNSISGSDTFKRETIKKEIINIVKTHELNIRDITISPDEKYLISCSELKFDEVPYVLVWDIEKLLEKQNEPAAILKIEGEKQNKSKDPQLANWLLCVDSTIKNVDGEDLWFVCAGSLYGILHIWSGKIDENSREWIFENSNFKKISILEEEEQTQRAIFKIKILENINLENIFSIYLVLNDIQTIGSESTNISTIKEITLKVDQSILGLEINSSKIIGTHNGWILAFDLYNKTSLSNNERFIVSGSSDGIIKKWELTESSRGTSLILGKHEDAVTCLKISENGDKVASGSADSSIRIWIINSLNAPKDIIIGHHDNEIVSLDFLKDENLLISASKDNTIKIWDTDRRLWIRNIEIDNLIQSYLKNNKRENEIGLDFLRDIIVSPDNRYVYVIKKNKLIILRNFGRVWHFYQQLKYIKKTDNDLFKIIYGENLRQICRNIPDKEESLRKIYQIIKKRLIDKNGNYNSRLLASLFIPSFVTFEDDFNYQKDYISSVQSKYDEYWYSLKNIFLRKPEIKWKFKFYITTDIESEIEEVNFVEITNPKNRKINPYIILIDRGQSQIRFLLVLNIVPTTFIPLLKSINLDVEDDRGDKDTLIFTDFNYAESNFIRKLSDPEHSLDKIVTETNLPNNFYYSHCIFKLDEGYNTEDFAFISIRKTTLEFSKSLNPLETTKNIPEDVEIFETFRNNFQEPILPKTQVKIGKGAAAAAGKKIDDFLSRLILLEFIFSIMDVLALVIFPEELKTLAGLFVFSTGVIGIIIIAVAFIMMLRK